MKTASYIKNTENDNSGYINYTKQSKESNENYKYLESDSKKINFTLPVYPIQREIRTITIPNNNKINNNYTKHINTKNYSNTIQHVNNYKLDNYEKTMNSSNKLDKYKDNDYFKIKTLEQHSYKTIENSLRGRKNYSDIMHRSKSFNDKDMFSYSSFHHKFNYKNNLRQYSFGFKETNYNRDDHITYKNKYFNNNFSKNYLIYPEIEPIRIRSAYLRVDTKERIFPSMQNSLEKNFNRTLNKFYFENKEKTQIENFSRTKTQFDDREREIHDTKYNILNVESKNYNLELGTKKIKGISLVKEPDFRSCIKIDVRNNIYLFKFPRIHMVLL
jgi:hypothetical protein